MDFWQTFVPETPKALSTAALRLEPGDNSPPNWPRAGRNSSKPANFPAEKLFSRGRPAARCPIGRVGLGECPIQGYGRIRPHATPTANPDPVGWGCRWRSGTWPPAENSSLRWRRAWPCRKDAVDALASRVERTTAPTLVFRNRASIGRPRCAINPRLDRGLDQCLTNVIIAPNTFMLHRGCVHGIYSPRAR